MVLQLCNMLTLGKNEEWYMETLDINFTTYVYIQSYFKSEISLNIRKRSWRLNFPIYNTLP